MLIPQLDQAAAVAKLKRWGHYQCCSLGSVLTQDMTQTEPLHHGSRVGLYLSDSHCSCFCIPPFAKYGGGAECIFGVLNEATLRLGS